MHVQKYNKVTTGHGNLLKIYNFSATDTTVKLNYT